MGGLHMLGFFFKRAPEGPIENLLVYGLQIQYSYVQLYMCAVSRCGSFVASARPEPPRHALVVPMLAPRSWCASALWGVAIMVSVIRRFLPPRPPARHKRVTR